MGGALICYYDKLLGNVNFMGNGTFNGRSCNEILNSVKTNNPMIESLHIFPNPSSDWIEVNSDHVMDLHIYDFNGIQVLQRKLDAGTTKINLETIEPGMYLVKVNGRYVQKLIKI